MISINQKLNWIKKAINHSHQKPFKVAFALLGYAMAKNYGKEE